MSDVIRRLRELEGRATPGPWEHRTGPNDEWDIVYLPGGQDFAAWLDKPQAKDDAALIAAMRNHLAALLDVAEAAQNIIGLEDHPHLRRALARLETAGQ